jgi:exonuclease III
MTQKPAFSSAISLLALLLTLLVACAEPVDSDLPIGPQVPSIDSDATISIVTWNIENFPQQGLRTSDRVELILDSLNADFYCLQEIQDKGALEDIVDQLDQYSVIISDETSFMHLAIIYKQDSFLPVFTENLFASNDYNFASRPPLLVSFLYSFEGREQVLNLINVHMKCCNDGIERRHQASIQLQDYLSNKMAWGDSNFVVPGDWNDDIYDTDNSGQYSFEAFLNDGDNFQFATDSLAASTAARDASYPSYGSFIDNILISRSLFDEERHSSVSTILLDEVFGDYSSVVSDHRPVVWSFKPQ